MNSDQQEDEEGPVIIGKMAIINVAKVLCGCHGNVHKMLLVTIIACR